MMKKSEKVKMNFVSIFSGEVIKQLMNLILQITLIFHSKEHISFISWYVIKFYNPNQITAQPKRSSSCRLFDLLLINRCKVTSLLALMSHEFCLSLIQFALRSGVGCYMRSPTISSTD